MRPIPQDTLDRQRCHECGAWLAIKDDSDRRTELPRSFLGLPVNIICDACFAEKEFDAVFTIPLS